jgi:hypothetical protein
VTETSDIQFDRAEFDQPAGAAACAHCGNGLREQYYQVNGLTVCPACCGGLRASADHGTRGRRVLRAVGAGTAAAIGGSLLYWAILAVTGYEFGLIAVVVGIGVGKAVHWGSRGKGGWRYQTLAMALTYLAMVSAYVPLLVAEMRSAPTSQSSTRGTASEPRGNTDADASRRAEAGAPPTVLGAVFAIIMLVAIICALPFLAGIENVLGIMILGFGLYEAWKLNRRTELTITGPHAIASLQLT